MKSNFERILEEICDEEGIELEYLSLGWLKLLRKDGKTARILGYKVDLNSAAASMTADDKYATYEVLRREGVAAVECEIVYPEENQLPYAKGRNTLAYIEEFFERNGGEIVLKPNKGYTGENVYKITEKSAIKAAAEAIFRRDLSASMCPYYDAEAEYRVIILDGEVRLIYRKVKGEDWRFNLSQGARAEEVKDAKLRSSLSKMAQKAVLALGLRMAAVDIFRLMDGSLKVLEVNSGVIINRFLTQNPEKWDLAKDIYRDMIKKML